MNELEALLAEHTELETERLYLRPITIEDAEDMFEYTSDEETTRYLYDPHKDLAQTKRVIENYFAKEPIGKYALVLKDNGKMIGAIEFRVDDWNKSGDLGFTMNRHYWGKGYMTEAGKCILKVGFETLGLERVFAGHEEANIASGRVLKRLGMTREGVLRKDQMIRGKLVNSVHYSILKDEYFD